MNRKKQSIGHKLILVGNVLHAFVYSMLLLEYLETDLVFLGMNYAFVYGFILLLTIPNIICYRKLLRTKNNWWALYYIAFGFLFTLFIIALFYIIGAFIVIFHNNRLREEERKRRVKL